MSRAVIFMCLLGACAAGHQVFIHNYCHQTIWVGILGKPYPIPERGGFELRSGQSHTSTVVNNWSGRVWGRTRCGGSQCETGDCGGGKIQCNGAGGIPPATLAEITFDAGSSHNQDFYDISLVDGYNLKMSMAPRQGTFNPGSGHYYCTRAGCNTDLNKICPSELQVHGTGGVVACMSACMKFNRDDYCCRGAHATPQTCPPFSYSRTFKQACPDAYSYAYDDQSSTFTCNGHGAGTTAYDIYFC
ncbi:hypothetical protein CHS0354_016013 [Potamilus streckersoni]|uniref:Thaumatin-like protein n=1 Tax=Potamilus streckersoni TaxID=2493646 RepID=A0AAE0RMH9_9BIVA|nr:hypothetical protein CHS0354_016013 [Potamilus streckersoni]